MADAVGGIVEVGVCGIDGHTGFNGLDGDAGHGVILVNAPQRTEEQRMMRHHEVAPRGDGFVDNVFADVNAQ